VLALAPFVATWVLLVADPTLAASYVTRPSEELLRIDDSWTGYYGRFWWLVHFFPGAAVILAGGAAVRVGRRMRATQLEFDGAEFTPGTRPVLYLRSFGDDHRLAAEPGEGPIDRLLQHGQTAEYVLVDELRRRGFSVVTVARPGERLAPLGATRIRIAEHGAWQQAVEELIGAAELVILRPGASAGLLWEVERTFGASPANRLALFFPPPRRADVLAQFFGHVERELGQDLPYPAFTDFIYFDGHERPRLLHDPGPATASAMSYLQDERDNESWLNLFAVFNPFTAWRKKRGATSRIRESVGGLLDAMAIHSTVDFTRSVGLRLLGSWVTVMLFAFGAWLEFALGNVI